MVVAVVKSEATGHTGFLNSPTSFLSCVPKLRAEVAAATFQIQEDPFSLSRGLSQRNLQSPALSPQCQTVLPTAWDRAPPCLPRQENRKQSPPCQEVGLTTSLS